MREAYGKIRAWYQANTDKIDSDAARAAAPLKLIRAMPDPRAATVVEMRAVAWEVMSGYGEWAYVESDGDKEMHEYAKEILTVDGELTYLTDDDRAELRQSPIFAMLFNTRNLDAGT